MKHKAKLLSFLPVLIDNTRSERGYSSVGRLLTRLLHTLIGVYPLNSRFVNTAEWENEGEISGTIYLRANETTAFANDHNLQWGKFYEPEQVQVEWHGKDIQMDDTPLMYSPVPSDDEIAFALDILDQIATPLLDRVESLTSNASSWNGADRNDFCRLVMPALDIYPVIHFY
jgi:proteasome activator subunit 4